MQLTRIEDIGIDNATRELLNDVKQAAHKVNELRPLDQAMIQEVQRDLLGERVYTSNAIEGSTLGLRETIEILKAGHVGAEIEKKREATEAINLGNAIDEIMKIDSDAIASIEQFLAVHKTLFQNINDEWAGRLRHDRVMIRGAKHQPPHHNKVGELLDLSFEYLGKAEGEDTVTRAAWIHWAIARIHPFFDGNGRMGRLWQDLILFNGQLTCAVIRPQDRDDYLEALQSADDGDFNLIIQLVGQRTITTLNRYLGAKQKVESIDIWATKLAKETGARTAEARRRSYMGWKRKMEELQYEFERCAAKITQVVQGVDIQFRSYEIIDETTWDSLRSGIGAGKTWFFWLGFQKGPRYFRYYFFFGKHFSSRSDDPEMRSEPRVALLISEAEGGGEGKRLAEDSDSPITLRQLLVVENDLVRMRHTPHENPDSHSEPCSYDRGMDATIVAQDFIQEVLLRRLT